MPVRVQLGSIVFLTTSAIRARTVAHQDDLVSQQNRFIDVMRDHEHRLPGSLADFQELFLDHAASA